jgi:hypothetical protein
MALKSSYLKLNWARELIELFGSDVERYLGDENYQAVKEPQVFESDGSSRVALTLKIVHEAPVDLLSVRIGDIVHNLRSSLDHAIFEISQSNRAGMTIKNEKILKFPICVSEKDFEEDLKRGVIENLPSAAIEYIRSLQPFAKSEGTLFELREISNADKHRTIQITLISIPYMTRTMTTNLGGLEPKLCKRLLTKYVGIKFGHGTVTRKKDISIAPTEIPKGYKLAPLENGSSLGGMMFGTGYGSNLPPMTFFPHFTLVFEQGQSQNKEVVSFLKNCSTEVEGILDALMSLA